MAKKLVILGAGGYGAEALWVADAMNLQNSPDQAPWEFIGFLDDNPEKKGSKFCGFEVLGTSSDFNPDSRSGQVYFHCAVGKNKTRERAAQRLTEKGLLPATLTHPSVIAGPGVEIGQGTYIAPGVIIGPYAKLGNFVLINAHAGVGHDAIIDDFAQLCPGSRVNGGCKVDKLAFIGSNAAIQPGVRIGEQASVGAGSFVIRSVRPLFSVIGVPARTVSRPANNESPAQ